MLRFQESPDPAFVAILATALEARADWLEDHYVNDPNLFPPGEWTRECPRLHRSLTLEQAIAQQRLLRGALIETTLYMPTDMQFLVLYDALEHFTDLYNDDMKLPIECRELRYGPYPIEYIDFDAIVEIFFWDTDFLINLPHGATVHPFIQQELSGSAIRAFSGRTAQLEDLQLEVEMDEKAVPPDQATSFYEPEKSQDYPFSDDHDEFEDDEE